MDGVDSRGVKRGNCLDCICKGYDGGSEKKKCVRCEHPPGKHANLSPNQPTRTCTTRSSVSSALSDGFGGQSMYAQCLYPQCTEETYFDLNTREEKPFCKRHLTAQPTKRSDGYTVMPALGSVQGNLAHTGLSVVTMIPAVPATIGSSSSARLSSSQTAGQSQSVSLPVARPISAVVPKQYVNPVMMHTTGQQQLCKLPECNQPVCVEAGRVHEFCRRYHAEQFQQRQSLHVSSHLRCSTPGCEKQKHPNVNPDGGYYDYRSLYCRDNGAKLLASASAPNLLTAAGTGSDNICSLPECNKRKYVDSANGRIHDYCGRTHASKARSIGIQPTHPVTIRAANGQELSRVSGKFVADWIKGNPPKVDFMFVISSTFLEQRWKAYKQSLGDQTVEPHYHGTKLTCNIIVTHTPCGDQNCGICGISCNGLDCRFIQKNINFQRFGRGFYLAPHSSKCHDYTQGSNGYRAMLLCDVCPGNKYYLQSDNEKLTGPPPGYNSVFGQVGGSLNYPEIVVYNPDAVMPRYVIVYQKNGTHKIAT